MLAQVPTREGGLASLGKNVAFPLGRITPKLRKRQAADLTNPQFCLISDGQRVNFSLDEQYKHRSGRIFSYRRQDGRDLCWLICGRRCGNYGRELSRANARVRGSGGATGGQCAARRPETGIARAGGYAQWRVCIRQFLQDFWRAALDRQADDRRGRCRGRAVCRGIGVAAPGFYSAKLAGWGMPDFWLPGPPRKPAQPYVYDTA